MYHYGHFHSNLFSQISLPRENKSLSKISLFTVFNFDLLLIVVLGCYFFLFKNGEKHVHAFQMNRDATHVCEVTQNRGGREILQFL